MTNLFDYDCNTDKLICQVCGFQSNQLYSHITKTHNMTLSDYQKLFNNARISRLTDEQIEKMRITKLKRETKNSRYLKEKLDREKELDNCVDLECRICGFTSKLSLISHITRKHKITMNEYRRQYPNDIIQRAPPSTGKKLSVILKEKFETDEEYRNTILQKRSFASEIKHWTRKGYSEEEAKEKVSEFQRNLSLRQNNERTRKLKSKRASGKNNPMSLESIAKRNNVSLEEASTLTPAYGRSGDLHPMWGKTHTEEVKMKIAEKAGKHFSQRSKGEDEVYKYLTEKNINVKRNTRVLTYNCDFVFEDIPLIIEYFGDYWHCNPVKFGKDYYHKRLKIKASDKWAHDNTKLEKLRQSGYNVIVIWEYDWKLNKELIIEEILSVTNNLQR